MYKDTLDTPVAFKRQSRASRPEIDAKAWTLAVASGLESNTVCVVFRAPSIS